MTDRETGDKDDGPFSAGTRETETANTAASSILPLTPETESGGSGGSGGVEAMAKEIERLTQQLDAIRKEAFEDGRRAGLKEVADLLRQLARGKADASPGGNADTVRIAPIIDPETNKAVMPRGASLMIVEEIMRANAPKAMGPKQVIEAAFKRDGTRLSETSAGRSIRMLAERGVVEQVGPTKTWRYVSRPRAVS